MNAFITGVSTSLIRQMRTLSDNPVIAKGFRTRMRGWKGFLVMGGYTIAQCIILLIAYAGMSAQRSFNPTMSGVANPYGQGLALTLFWTQTILIALIVPALTSSSLSGEIEKKTIDLLTLTRLSAGKIVLGKMLTNWLYMLMIIGSSLPLASLIMVFGGVSMNDLLLGYVALAGWALLFCSVGIFWSSVLQRTSGATLCSFGVCGIYTLLSGIIGAAGLEFAYGGGLSNNIPVFMGINPGFMPMIVGMKARIFGVPISPLAAPLILHAVISVLLLLLASTFVLNKKAERARIVKILLVAVTTGILVAVIGDAGLLWGRIGSAADFPLIAGVGVLIMAAMLALASIVFATGPLTLKPKTPLLAYILSPSLLFKNDIGGSMGFMMLWAILMSGICAFAFKSASHIYTFSLGKLFWPNYAHMTCVFLTFISALTAIGLLLSTLLRRRRDALGAMVFIVLAFFGTYAIIWETYDRMRVYMTNAPFQLAALWPITPVVAMSKDEWKQLPPISWSRTDSWLVVSATYLTITTIALILASITSKRGRGIAED